MNHFNNVMYFMSTGNKNAIRDHIGIFRMLDSSACYKYGKNFMLY